MRAILVCQSISDWNSGVRKQKQEQNKSLFIVQLHLAFSFVGMLFALLLMYKLTEGSKHLLTFMAVGIFVVSLMNTRYYKKAALLGVTFVYFYSYLAVQHPYDYQVPFVEEVRSGQLADASKSLSDRMELVTEDVPNYENSVIWVLYDNVLDESDKVVQRSTKWQLLYALPKGFGISCCQGEYVRENLESLQSRYLATNVDGEIDERCKQAGCAELYRDHEVVFYDISSLKES